MHTEFDFVATGNCISFNYVFGSDEYLEWVNSSTMIYLPFLLGQVLDLCCTYWLPGGAINIAQVPNSNPQLSITVSSVNDVTNPMYYIDNFNNDGVCIDGFTTLFTASSDVQAGQTYHIKLAIEKMD